MEEEWAQHWDIAGAAAHITERGFTIVALQFPDELLKEAAAVGRALQDACAAAGAAVQVFVMADTTYNSLGVDEVAAQHANAHCVIHYGRAALSPLSRLPAYFAFTRTPLDAEHAAARIAGWAAGQQGQQALAGKKAVLVLPDLPLVWAVSQLRECLASAAAEAGVELPFVVADVPQRWMEPRSGAPGSHTGAAATASGKNRGCSAAAEMARPSSAGAPGASPSAGKEQPAALLSSEGSSGAAGLALQLPEGIETGDCAWLWLGEDDAPALTQLLVTHSREQWALFDPRTGSMREGVPQDISRTLLKRRYLIERARSASIVGIVVGTLGVAGCLGVAEAVRALARSAGKKTYTLLMGKPSPVKLANFPEVDIFVMVADAQGQILDSKDFYAPIITPFEAQIAFGSEGDQATAVPERYSLDFDPLLASSAADAPGDVQQAPRLSRMDGGYHGGAADASGTPANALAERAAASLGLRAGPGKLAEVRSAAEYLQSRRTFRGLETTYTGADVKPVTAVREGRSGRAAGYADEPRSENH